LQVRLFAGKDPVTGRDVYLAYLAASIPGTDRKAHKRAEDKLAEFRTQVNKQRSTPSSVKLGYALDEWLRTSEHEDSTREGYLGYIARTIRPALGDVPIAKITARLLASRPSQSTARSLACGWSLASGVAPRRLGGIRRGQKQPGYSHPLSASL
jgi:integrase